MKKIRNILIVLMAVMVIVPTGCKKDKGDPPVLPPESSMVMDYSDFKDNDKSLKSVLDTTYQNWGFSAINVGVWNIVLTVSLAVPVATFIESFNHDAVLDDSDWWVWSYTKQVGLYTYSAELKGKVVNQTVNWEMYISQNGGFQDFLWYTGESNTDGTEGFWIMYKSPADPSELLRIDWTNSNGVSDIQYKNIVPNGPENGGYIKYGVNNDTPYNAFYDIYNKGQDNLTEIEWNRTTKDGHVKDYKHFNDSVYHCWDSTLVDISCL